MSDLEGMRGSVLDPLLFLVLIGDIDTTLQHSEASSFADDTRIKKQISSVEDASYLTLQRILEWAAENNMALNGDKFELLRYVPMKRKLPHSATKAMAKVFSAKNMSGT
ncbi:hypothetical protein Pcinc_031720 [Petrolisthes cinctipes]|uniref:Reverse transcriptase domain-containing protein n=1 Tax=Petrolisthes cinctipes TaxID=88211 RepID=A0AAE1K4G2_PETCI|nr:hypothetical protein Pcinc_031720 [Petrolisthes cinctipes]